MFFINSLEIDATIRRIRERLEDYELQGHLTPDERANRAQLFGYLRTL